MVHETWRVTERRIHHEQGMDQFERDYITTNWVNADRYINERATKLYDKGYKVLWDRNASQDLPESFVATHRLGYRVICRIMMDEPELPKSSPDNRGPEPNGNELELAQARIEMATYERRPRLFTRKDDCAPAVAKRMKNFFVQEAASVPIYTDAPKRLTQLSWDELLDTSLIPSITKLSDYAIKDGYYTILLKDGDNDDGYVTIRVKSITDGSKFNGKRIVSFLSGPDNENDYTGFAFLYKEQSIVIWSRFRNNERLGRAIHGLVLNHLGAGETYALKSGRCCICGRTLTVPASLYRGMGPVCAGRASGSE